METIVAEEWRPIAGLKGKYHLFYEVSNLGRVRSIDREIIKKDGKKQFIKGQVLKAFTRKNKYQQVILNYHGEAVTKRIHVLVAYAFLSPCPGVHGCKKGEYVVDHIDKNRQNNHASNLRWLIVKESSLQGHTPERQYSSGTKHGMSKLTDEDIIKIRNDTRSYSQIASDYNINAAAVGKIIRNETWTHVEYSCKNKQNKIRKLASCGENSKKAKLTEKDAASIISDQREYKEIMAQYGISETQVYRIKAGISWKHLHKAK